MIRGDCFAFQARNDGLQMGTERVELSSLAAQHPKCCVSANSTTSPCGECGEIIPANLRFLIDEFILVSIIQRLMHILEYSFESSHQN